MASRIKLSKFATILTIFLLPGLFIVLVLTLNAKPAFYSILPIFLILLIYALFFGVFCIKANSEYVIMQSRLRNRKILVKDIKSIEMFQPTMGAIRICASGGFMGYWVFFKKVILVVIMHSTANRQNAS